MSPRDPDQITGKGTTLKAALAFVESQPGPSPMQRPLRELDPATRGLVSGMIVPSPRYPPRQLVTVNEGIDRAFGRGDLARSWDIGRFSADHEVKVRHTACVLDGADSRRWDGTWRTGQSPARQARWPPRGAIVLPGRA